MTHSKSLNIKKSTLSRKRLSIIIAAILVFLSIILIGNIIIDNQKRIEREKEEQEIAEQKRIEEEIAQQIKEEQDRIAYLENLPDLQFNTVFKLSSLNLNSKLLDIPIIYQYPELPAGCECIALTNQLNYYGFILDKFKLVDDYLPISDYDFVYRYMGDPYDEYWGGAIMSPGLNIIANQYLEDKKSQYKSFDISGRNFKDLYAYVERGNPVQIWTSISMENLGCELATSEDYTFFDNSHSVLIEGFDRENDIVYIADSIDGHCEYSASLVEKIYNRQNKQAVIIVSQKELDSWVSGQEQFFEPTYNQGR